MHIHCVGIAEPCRGFICNSVTYPELEAGAIPNELACAIPNEEQRARAETLGGSVARAGLFVGFPWLYVACRIGIAHAVSSGIAHACRFELIR